MSQTSLHPSGSSPDGNAFPSCTFPKTLAERGAASSALRCLGICILLVGLFQQTPLLAGDTAPGPASADNCAQTPCNEAATANRSRLLSIVDKTHDNISRRLEAAVRGADTFFATDNVFEDTNASYARIPMDLIVEDDGNVTFKVRVKGKLSLPNTQKRLKLLIESGTTESIFDDQAASSPPDAITDNDYFLSLETQLKKTGKWKIRPAVGLKFQWTPDLFVRLRAIRYFAVTRKWLGRFSLTGVYLLDARLQSDGNLQLSRAIRKDFLFRSTSKLKWTDEKDYSEASQIFSLFQHLSQKANLAYQGGVFADNQAQGWDVTEYRTWLRYRRLVYRNWLFMDLIPEIRFRQDDDYDPSYLLTLRMEPVFGQALPTTKLQKVD